MTTKIAIIITCVAGIIVIVALSPRRQTAQPKVKYVPAQQVQAASRPVINARSGFPADHLAEYRGHRVPILALPKLELAEKCKAKADELSGRFDSQHIAHTLLNQIGPKLLKEDTAYALGDRQKILDYFDWLSARPEYTNIAAIVASYDNDPAASGLFLDASIYVALRCQNREWQEQEAADAEAKLVEEKQVTEASKSEGASPKLGMRAAFLTKTTPSYLDLAAKRVKQFDDTQDAYRELFAFRLSERYGLPGDLLEKLDPVILTNAGPELAVP
jgi:hypothetical protein